MELAGVVLGGIPLMLYAFDNYRRVAEKVRDYLKYDVLLNRLQDRLFIQEEQFDITLDSVGLRGMTLQDIESHLHVIQPQKASRFVSIIKRINEIAETVARKLELSSAGKPDWQLSDERLKWEIKKIRRSLEKGELKLLLDELDEWNTGLKNCFERFELPSAESTEDRTVKDLNARFDVGRCETAIRNAQVLHETLKKSWKCSCANPHKSNLRLNWHTTRVLTPEQFEMALSYERSAASVSSEVWKRVDAIVDEPGATLITPRPPLQPSPQSSINSQPTVSGRRVRFQNLLSSKNKKAAPLAQQPASLCTPTVASISTVHTPSHLDTLCPNIGTCIDEVKHLGYLLNPDTTPTQHINIRSTRFKPLGLTATAISEAIDKMQNPNIFLTRKERFETAASITWAILLLSGTDWLSDGLDRKELQLMLDLSGPGSKPVIDGTYVSHLDDPSTTSAPATSFQKLLRNRTLFALGILLIELCLDRTFAELKQEVQTRHQMLYSSTSTGATSTPILLDDLEVANSLTDRVYSDAGDQYGYAVQRCLRCEFPGRDNEKTFDFAEFRTNFFRGVVAPVQARFDLELRAAALVVV